MRDTLGIIFTNHSVLAEKTLTLLCLELLISFYWTNFQFNNHTHYILEENHRSVA